MRRFGPTEPQRPAELRHDARSIEASTRAAGCSSGRSARRPLATAHQKGTKSAAASASASEPSFSGASIGFERAVHHRTRHRPAPVPVGRRQPRHALRCSAIICQAAEMLTSVPARRNADVDLRQHDQEPAVDLCVSAGSGQTCARGNDARGPRRGQFATDAIKKLQWRSPRGRRAGTPEALRMSLNSSKSSLDRAAP